MKIALDVVIDAHYSFFIMHCVLLSIIPGCEGYNLIQRNTFN